MIKAAFPYWNNRIAPVFDIARRIHIIEAESGNIISEKEVMLAEDVAIRKAMRLADLGIGTLVCGAISRSLHEMIVAYGIQVIPFIAGDLPQVIDAWLKDELGDSYAMPGCCKHGRRFGINRENYQMNNGNRGGGGGRGQGRGRMGGQRAAGVGGTCVCPQCGHRETHERGVPCTQKQCPKCGTVMNRE
jgi:predicted Fe-Mo cluster-binding NifX family protein